MKKIVLLLGLLVAALYAGKWNIPNGEYTCRIVSINNVNWKPVKMIPRSYQERNKTSFILTNKGIIDVDGDVFTPRKTNSERTNVFLNIEVTDAVYIPVNSKLSNGEYVMGLGHLKNGDIMRMTMRCKREE